MLKDNNDDQKISLKINTVIDKKLVTQKKSKAPLLAEHNYIINKL